MAVFTENVEFRGITIVHDFRPQGECIGNEHIKSDANVDAAKLQHAHRAIFAQASGDTASAESRVVHVVHGTAGTIQAVKAGAVTPNVGAATCTIDVYKNGATVLTGTFNLTSSESAYELVAGTIDAAEEDVVAGDVIEVVLTVNAGGGTLAEGVFCYVDIFEEAD